MTADPIVLPQFVAARQQIGPRSFDFDRQAVVMAVVNRTPDSFYDEGRTFALDSAVNAALEAAALGADWVDIGGVAFSPDTPAVRPEDELARVLPVVERVAAGSDVVISVDTTSALVARPCIEAGAAVVNDTSGFHDPAMVDVVAETGASVIITHSLGEPHVHWPRPAYSDIAAEITQHLAARVERALSHGVRPEQIIVDPGHDLNKNTRQTLELTRRMAELTTALPYPMLAAVSRKDFVGETLDRPKDERLAGGLAAATLCLAAGARILRMHDVAASVDTVRMFGAVMGWREPAWEKHNL